MTHNRKSPMGRGGEPNLRGVRLHAASFSAGAFASAAAAAAASSAEYEKICDPEQERRSGQAWSSAHARVQGDAGCMCSKDRRRAAHQRVELAVLVGSLLLGGVVGSIVEASLAEATFLEAERVDAVALTLFLLEVGAA